MNKKILDTIPENKPICAENYIHLPTKQLSTFEYINHHLHKASSFLSTILYPKSLFSRPTQDQIIKEKLKIVQKNINQDMISIYDKEHILELTQRYSKEDVDLLIKKFKNKAKSLEVYALIAHSAFKKNVNTPQGEFFKQLIHSNGIPILTHKCLYHGSIIPAYSIHTDSFAFDEHFNYHGKIFTSHQIIKRMLEPDEKTAGDIFIFNKFLNSIMQIDILTSYTPATFSRFLALKHAYKKQALLQKQKKPEHPITETPPILIEICGDIQKPAKAVPTLGSKYILGSEDEIYLSRETFFSFIGARINENNNFVISAKASDHSTRKHK